MQAELKKEIWKEAATGGLYLGMVLLANSVAEYLFRDSATVITLTGFIRFLAIIYFSYTFARKISAMYRPAGFTIMQSLGFILKMMLFAGIITGLSQSIMFNLIDPQYYYDMMETAMTTSGLSEAQMELMRESMPLVRNPIVMIMGGVMSMLLYGGLIGLMVSVFVKRPPEQSQTNI